MLALLCIVVGGELTILSIFFRPTSGEQPAPRSVRDLALAAGGIERIEFPTADGVILRGEILGSLNRPLVIFGHGFRGRRRHGDHLAVTLLPKGYSLLLFDFRACGESDGTLSSAGPLEAEDVRGVLRYLTRSRHVPLHQVSYVGISMGAAAALLAADELTDLASVVLIAPYATLFDALEARTLLFTTLPITPWFEPARWGLRGLIGRDAADVRPVDQAETLRNTPVLVIGGDVDRRARPEGVREIAERIGASAELRVVPGFDHREVSLLKEPILTDVTDFLDAHLGDANELPIGGGLAQPKEDHHR